MIEKGSYQFLYQPDGKMERLIFDRDGDGRADVVVMYGANAKPTVGQIDSNQDGVVDRWEYFDTAGDLSRIGRSRRTPGTPDAWNAIDKAGTPTRSEFDEDGDGEVDRTEYLAKGKVFLEELDTDHDGKPDRRQFFSDTGAVLRVEADKEGDGYWEPTPPVKR